MCKQHAKYSGMLRTGVMPSWPPYPARPLRAVTGIQQQHALSLAIPRALSLGKDSQHIVGSCAGGQTRTGREACLVLQGSPV